MALKPSVHPYRLVIASEGVAVAWQSPGREDVVSYTIPLQPSARRFSHVISSEVDRSRGSETKPSAHGRKTLSAGDFSTAFGLSPHSGRNDILNQAGVQDTPLHIGRKDIETRPAVVIASEGVAAAWQSPGREHGRYGTVYFRQTLTRGRNVARVPSPAKCLRRLAVATVSEIDPSSAAARQPPEGKP